MAYTVQTGAVATVASGNLTLNYPASRTAGDIFLACITIRDTVGFTAPSADWHLIRESLTGDTDTTNGVASSQVWWFRYAGSGTSATFTRTGGDLGHGAILGVSGCTPTGSPVDASAVTTVAGTSLTAPNVTATASGDPRFLCWFAALGDNGTVSTQASTTPSGGSWSELELGGTNTGADGGGCISYHSVGLTAGATTASVTGTSTTDGTHVVTTVALRPSIPFTASPGVGALAFTKYAPSLLLGLAITVGGGTLTFTGYAPSVSVRAPIVPEAGALALTGYAPTLAVGPPLRVTQIPVDVLYTDATPAVRVTQIPVDVLYTQSVPIRVTQITVDVLYRPAWYPSPDPAALTFTGYAPTVVVAGSQAFTVTPDAGALSLTGAAPSLSTGFGVTVPAGALTVTGAAPAAVQAVLRTPGAGAILLTGGAPTVFTGAILTVPAGSLTLTGTTPTVQQAVTLTPGAGSLVLAGATPTALASVRVTVPAGALVLTGRAPEVDAPRVIQPSWGILTLVGYPPVVGWGGVIEVPTGSLVLAGAAPTTGGRVIVVPAGALVLDGTEAYPLAAPPDPVPVAATTRHIRRLRRAPFLSADGGWLFHHRFEVLLEAGMGLTTGQGVDPQIMVRWSDNGGHTWSDEHWTSAGRMGQYRRRALWRRLGRSRNRVYEVVISDPVKVAWIHAALDVQAGAS